MQIVNCECSLNSVFDDMPNNFWYNLVLPWTI